MESILFKEINCIVGQEANQVSFLAVLSQSVNIRSESIKGFYFKSSVYFGAIMIAG